MEPDTKDRDSMYRLIIGQLYQDGHKQLALDLSNSIGLKSLPPPSDKLFRLVSAARQVADDTDEEEKEDDMQMSLNSLLPSIDNLTIDEESRDYFPFLALPNELKALVFSVLSIKDRFALAGVNRILNKIEKESKYYVEKLIIVEKPSTNAPTPYPLVDYPSAQSIVFIDGKLYSSNSIRRIANNASIGILHIELRGSSEFHREVYNLMKEIDIRDKYLYFEDKDLEKELMEGSFLLDLTRTCEELSIDTDYVSTEKIHELYKIVLDGSTKLRHFCALIEKEKCISFLQLIGITYRDDTFFSNRDIEVFDDDGNFWRIFDGQLEIILYTGIFENREDVFHLLHHESQESLEEAKNVEGMEIIEIDAE